MKAVSAASWLTLSSLNAQLTRKARRRVKKAGTEKGSIEIGRSFTSTDIVLVKIVGNIMTW